MTSLLYLSRDAVHSIPRNIQWRLLYVTQMFKRRFLNVYGSIFVRYECLKDVFCTLQMSERSLLNMHDGIFVCYECLKDVFKNLLFGVCYTNTFFGKMRVSPNNHCRHCKKTCFALSESNIYCELYRSKNDKTLELESNCFQLKI